MVDLQDIFDIYYGNSLDLNKLDKSDSGVNFVSRTAKNNGVSAIVSEISGMKKIPKGTITVSLGGSVLEAFLQPEDYYTGYHIFCLEVKKTINLSDAEKLYYCSCIRANKYRYSYGRQANRTLRALKVPHFKDFPDWVNKVDLSVFDYAENPKFTGSVKSLYEDKYWETYTLGQLFELKKGKRLTKANMTKGDTPFIGSTDSNNGLTNTVGQESIHKGNVIAVNYNGSVGEAFYQPIDFWASDDVNVLYPRDEYFAKFNQFIALFIIPIIRQNKFKFSYGRKWHMDRMKETKISLPTKNGKLDLDYMEKYISSLPYSSNI
ncbi:S-CspCI protein [Vibrio sp. 10N.286.49.B3]|uniref:restriction endonuclease subunit S n=1 Tax=Vibrio TaxID=662 RepID=UPI00031E60EE|nr:MULTISPECIES: restriction endonuclease subunit S [Vibrio]OEE71551.1 S-CspCI protein [Vibrio ordalii FF-167]PMH42354.1 S-CspCI protein [Vibrio sp. 10N.286.49.B3]